MLTLTFQHEPVVWDYFRNQISGTEKRFIRTRTVKRWEIETKRRLEQNLNKLGLDRGCVSLRFPLAQAVDPNQMAASDKSFAFNFTIPFLIQRINAYEDVPLSLEPYFALVFSDINARHATKLLNNWGIHVMQIDRKGFPLLDTISVARSAASRVLESPPQMQIYEAFSESEPADISSAELCQEIALRELIRSTTDSEDPELTSFLRRTSLDCALLIPGKWRREVAGCFLYRIRWEGRAQFFRRERERQKEG